MWTRDLQVEHAEWLQRMFPGQARWMPALGCVEEAGELLHAVLKTAQSEVWGPEARHTAVRERMLDAVGDCGVFVCSLCNSSGWSFAEVASVSPMEGGDVRSLSIELMRAACMVAEPPHRRQHAELYVSALKAVATACGVDFEAAVRGAWEEVKGRSR